MSTIGSSGPIRCSASAIVLLVVIGLLTAGLQIALPWCSCRIAGNHPSDRSVSGKSDEEIFAEEERDQLRKNEPWREHARFDNLFLREPVSGNPHGKTCFASCTVFHDELILLVKDFPFPLDIAFPREVIHVDLKNGRIKTSIPPAGTHHVRSTESELWWLPIEIGFNEPFVQDGKPTAIKSDYSQEESRQFQVLNFVEGRWRETDQFVMGATGLPGFDSRSKGVFTCQSEGELWLIYVEPPALYLRKGFPTGTEDQVVAFDQRQAKLFDRMTLAECRQAGWKWFLMAKYDSQPVRVEFELKNCCGFWMEKQSPCLLFLEDREDSGISEFAIHRFSPSGVHEVRRVPSPIHNCQSTAWLHGDNGGWIQVVTSPAGNVYVISYDGSDGRFHFLRWDGNQFQLVAAKGSSRVWMVLLDAVVFTCLVLVIPMLCLGVMATLVHSRQTSRTFAFSHTTVELSSVWRRGLARLIDISFPLIFVVMSFVSHHDAMNWWNQIVQWNANLADSVRNFVEDPSWFHTESISSSLIELPTLLFSIPVVLYLFVPGIFIPLAQIVWQGRSGQTFGKMLLRIKIVRTTLRPCGFARSLLREILLVMDSMLFLSWIPGVICILSTRLSQRIGDLLADTIVISTRPQSTIAIM